MPGDQPGLRCLCMPSGLKLIGDDGQIQIDSQYRNYALLSSGSVVTQQDTNYAVTTVVADITYPVALDEAPIVLINCGVITAFLGSHIDSNNKYTGCRIETSGSATVYYKVLVPSDVLSQLTGWGMNIYDASGNLVFHSGFQYLRVYDLIVKSGSFTGNVNHYSRTTPFYMVNSIYGRESTYGKPLGVRDVDGNTAEINFVQVPDGEPAPRTAVVNYTIDNNRLVVCDIE